MNVTATVTITVYFVGLVNFSGTGGTREVVVPRATTAISHEPAGHPPVRLEVHSPDIVIAPVTAEQCAALGGPLLIMPGSKCLLSGVQGKRIILPTDTTKTLDTSAHNIPKLKALCTGVSGIKAEYLDDPAKYAMRLTLDSGTLDSCADGAAWGSRLTLTADNGLVTIRDVVAKKEATVTLSSGATIHIINRPPTRPATSGAEHFWWHYIIAEGATNCAALPTEKPTGSDCPAAIAPHHPRSHDAASGLGCSNSQYP